jgi:hypothetical protein
MRRLVVLMAAVIAAVAVSAGFATSAGAYGGGASHDTWQIGLSFNCNNTALCADQGGDGGFWGWVEFDRWSDGSITGDAQLTGCGHTTGGGGPGTAGAGHIDLDIYAAHIDPLTGNFIIDSASDPSFVGDQNQLGIPSAAGHYSFHPAPGISGSITVAYRAAR